MSYLKFDIGSLPVSSIQNAKVRLYVSSMSAGSATHQMYGITDDSWTESAITWDTGSPNHAATGYTITGVGTTALLQSETAVSTAGQYYEFDVTSFVNSQLSSGDKTLSFLAAGKDSTSINVIYSSREDTNKPQLVITYQ